MDTLGLREGENPGPVRLIRYSGASDPLPMVIAYLPPAEISVGKDEVLRYRLAYWLPASKDGVTGQTLANIAERSAGKPAVFAHDFQIPDYGTENWLDRLRS